MSDQEQQNGEDAPPKGQPINITLKDQNGNEVNFKLKTTTPLTKTVEAYTDQQGVASETLRFFFDGVRIVPGHTPGNLDMEDGDLIEVHQFQIGGSVVEDASAATEQPSEGEETVPAQPVKIKLQVVLQGQVDAPLEFELKTTTPLEKLMKAYCKAREINETSVRFFFEGDRLVKSDTAASKGMVHNSTIQAFLEQQGGDGEAEAGVEDGAVNGGKEEKERLEIIVKDQNENETTFKIKSTTSLGKIKNAYCERMGKDLKSVRFMFDGIAIQHNDTPLSLEMEDKDVIDVFTEQTGGGMS